MFAGADMTVPKVSLRTSEQISANFATVRSRIVEAALRSGRGPEAVTLVAVTKKWPLELLEPLVAAGASDLGENYPQELWRKAEALAGRKPAVRWHLIGHLQTNKARRTLPLRRDDPRGRFAQVAPLSQLAGFRAALRPLGLPSGQYLGRGEQARMVSGGDPRGCRQHCLMPQRPSCRPHDDGGMGHDRPDSPAFVRRARETRDALRQHTGLQLPHLSMGMSGDFETAILEGATLVRVGSALLEGVET